MRELKTVSGQMPFDATLEAFWAVAVRCREQFQSVSSSGSESRKTLARDPSRLFCARQ